MKTLGDIGDVSTETEVVLLEHEVPYEPFSKAVLEYERVMVVGIHCFHSCLPEETWSVADQDLSRRKDLRHLNVCSIDPHGVSNIFCKS